ncbi:MAG: YqeG family HAD IIIA-type phosphatase [Clostridia bacterium]|nr:YqeG family HAD IIIA-type phosphatase [Clostridia bacterium]
MFYPKKHFESIFDISPDFLSSIGIKAVILDIDNTLVTYGTTKPTDEVKIWLSSLKSCGISITISSNNNIERISKFCEGLDVFYTYNSAKPFGKCIRLTKKKYKVKRKEICIIGDQIFTDILCGNWGHIYSILVTPLVSPESSFIRFKRKLEKPVISSYKKKHPEEFGKE